MSYYKDLREYLTVLEQKGKLRRVAKPINKDTELHPLVRWQYRGLPESERTGFLFEKLTGVKGNSYDCRVATAVIAASRDVYALAMNCERDAIHARWTEAYQHPYPPRLVSTGPCKEEIHRGDTLLQHGGINEFAIPISTNGWEALPRLTAACWISKEPDTRVPNIGTYNGYVLGPLHTSMRCWHGHIVTHINKCRQRGVPLQVAAVLGPVPAVCMISVTRVPYGSDEMALAGGIAGMPIDVVKCETIDVEVPATAEIVLEGEIPSDYLESDAASGEHIGYMIINEFVNAFHIKCITHRKNPIWHDYISQIPPSESSVIRGIGIEETMRNFLVKSCGIAQVKDVAFHHCGGSWRFCVVRFQDVGGVKTQNFTVWQALTATLSLSVDYPKIVIAVDDDIDPWDLESVFWAVTFRYMPHRDTKIIQGRGASIDQSSGPYTIPYEERTYPTSRTSPQGGSAILMDATRKWGYTPVALPKRHYMERAKEIWQELGFPKLQPREPWFGRDLGMWPEQYVRQAELGEKGEFDEVAQELIKGRKKIE